MLFERNRYKMWCPVFVISTLKNRIRRNISWTFTLIFICAAYFGIIFFVQNLNDKLISSCPKQVHLDTNILEDFPLSTPSSAPTSHNFRKTEVDWQEIGGFDQFNEILLIKNLTTNFFVYSAYMDFYENENIIRVVAITPSYSEQKLYCHIFDKKKLLLGAVPGIIRTTRCPQNSLMFSAAYILCKLDIIFNTSSILPTEFFQNMEFVSVSKFSKLSEGFPPASMWSNILQIIIPTSNDTVEPHQFALCVQPIFNYDKVFEFVQWLEFHKMMGVSHFTFYNMSIGPRVSCVMRSKAFNEETPIQILKWSVPISNHSILHVNGQISQGNDCVFRYRGVSKYLVFVDLDEAIIPNYIYARNYEELIQRIDSDSKYSTNATNNTAQYQFRGGFFGSDFGEFPPPTAKKRKRKTDNARKSMKQPELEDLTIYKYVLRQRELFPHKIRSKIITIPRRVIEPGVHEIDEAVGDGIELMIPFETGFLHHYRHYGCGNNCSFVPQVYDFTGHFFALKLLEKVREAMKKLGKECDLGY